MSRFRRLLLPRKWVLINGCTFPRERRASLVFQKTTRLTSDYYWQNMPRVKLVLLLLFMVYVCKYTVLKHALTRLWWNVVMFDKISKQNLPSWIWSSCKPKGIHFSAIFSLATNLQRQKKSFLHTHAPLTFSHSLAALWRLSVEIAQPRTQAHFTDVVI